LALRRDVQPQEAGVMTAMNTQHGALHRPLAAVMQVGSLGGGLAVGAVVALRGNRKAGAATASAVVLSWLAAKGVKELTRRGRPADHLEGIVVRGNAQRGFGFPSGHAAVSIAAAVSAAKALPAPATAALAAAAMLTGVARMYVGAHLPLDISGGVGLGVAFGCAARLVQ
jgi:undecaprenyl-diphosphatase